MMASNLEFVQFVCDQMGGEVSYRKMFGEYGLYFQGKYFACVCDNQLFVKVTQAGKDLVGGGSVGAARIPAAPCACWLPSWRTGNCSFG